MRRISALLLWSLALAATWLLAGSYRMSPGHSGDAPARWPDGTRLARRDNGSTLVMFLHPRCPCSRASLGELEGLLARSGDRLRAVVVFDATAGGPDRFGLRTQAQGIAGASVVEDDGTERRRFGAKTSGQVLLYAADGRLVFLGGITAGRGHRGENAGLAAVETLIREAAVAAEPSFNCVHGPVFGCPLDAEAGLSIRSMTDDCRDSLCGARR